MKELLKLTQKMREKQHELSLTLSKLEHSIALRVLHPELSTWDTCATAWEQTNKSLLRPVYRYVVQINGVKHYHKPEDIPTALLNTMPTGRRR